MKNARCASTFESSKPTPALCARAATELLALAQSITGFIEGATEAKRDPVCAGFCMGEHSMQ